MRKQQQQQPKKKLIKRAGVWFVGKKKKTDERVEITIAVANTKMQMGC
jgi:hypothetical protein